MRQALVVLLVTLLAIVNVVTLVEAANVVLPNGDYYIHSGTEKSPIVGDQYFTADFEYKTGTVYLKSKIPGKSKNQIWRVRTHTSGRVSVESQSRKKNYVAERSKGEIRNSAILGVNPNQRKYNIKKLGSGSNVRYELSFPELIFGKVLVLGASIPDGEPRFAHFKRPDIHPDDTLSWIFTKV